ncbi:MAG: lipoate--protein ligase family protein [Candidatus Thorarchaeota archaeon]|nr:MAG: lipoate--protein ligase family protein [Candidatus Thorarchaeota archaeon]RLI57184.1 MAG: lipoate--protein ligase family protein [Candidatus Thorarchaeota archaeon]
MEEMRFIELTTNSAYENMAIDEAIMRGIRDGKSPPTLRLYRWKPSAVSIGTFQGMNDEVDIAFCRERGIDYIRRITGGGAVYHDYDGEVTYSIILPGGHRLAHHDIIESYKVICGGIEKALDILGIEAQFKPINDIVAGGKKISGNAQTRRHSCVLQHGTTLLDLDVHLMFSILKVPEEKISDKMVADVKERVTSVRDVLKRNVSIEELAAALQQGFAQALDVELRSGKLTDEEQQAARSLAADKYSTDEWNFSR